MGNDIGPNPPGEGAEITLHEVPMLSGLGLTMTGARPGGFGALNDSTNEICAPGDLICAAPDEAFNVANLPTTLKTLAGGAGQPVHALYATTQFWNLDGAPATEWTLGWAQGSSITRRIQNMADMAAGQASAGRDRRYLGFGVPRAAP